MGWSLAGLVSHHTKGLRIVAAIGVLAVVWGWGVAQYPELLPKTGLTIYNAAAPEATLEAIVVVFALTILLVGPGFVILFHLYGRQALVSEEVH